MILEFCGRDHVEVVTGVGERLRKLHKKETILEWAREETHLSEALEYLFTRAEPTEADDGITTLLSQEIEGLTRKIFYATLKAGTATRIISALNRIPQKFRLDIAKKLRETYKVETKMLRSMHRASWKHCGSNVKTGMQRLRRRHKAFEIWYKDHAASI